MYGMYIYYPKFYNYTAAAEKAWEKRMRKKLKRTLRRMNNFKGNF